MPHESPLIAIGCARAHFLLSPCSLSEGGRPEPQLSVHKNSLLMLPTLLCFCVPAHERSLPNFARQNALCVHRQALYLGSAR